MLRRLVLDRAATPQGPATTRAPLDGRGSLRRRAQLFKYWGERCLDLFLAERRVPEQRRSLSLLPNPLLGVLQGGDQGGRCGEGLNLLSRGCSLRRVLSYELHRRRLSPLCGATTSVRPSAHPWRHRFSSLATILIIKLEGNRRLVDLVGFLCELSALFTQTPGGGGAGLALGEGVTNLLLFHLSHKFNAMNK